MMEKKTMAAVFAGYNGSEKSTAADLAEKVGGYINADNIIAELYTISFLNLLKSLV